MVPPRIIVLSLLRTAADFSRIRNADLERFTEDRLLAILNRLGVRVEIRAKIRRTAPLDTRVPARLE